MKKLRSSAGWIVATVILAVFFVAIYGGLPQFSFPTSSSSPSSKEQPLQINREVVEYSLATEKTTNENPAFPADKLPLFTFDLTETKFHQILQSSQNGLKDYVTTKIQYAGAQKGDKEIEPAVTVNSEKQQLIVHPQDMPNFKPGMYKLSLTLRTIEGNVNLEQDFTWGVIAVNTDKSVYQPAETAKIGFGVLDDGGNTQCFDTAEVWAIITSPDGKITKLSSNENTIKESGECGPITHTNKADFLASYKTSSNGIYQIKVAASINGGPKREIEDYFKVDSEVKFDVTRHDFPTRIYPGSPYPVAFKVKAKDAYKGRMEEIVPKNFEIASINNNGKVVDAGEFKKIIWDINLAAGKETFYSYIIRFPRISPEFYLLGPIKIGDFKEARQWQIASDAINSTSGVVAYEENSGSFTYSRVWTGTTWSPAVSTTATTLDISPADSRWFVEKSSPKTGEKLVAAFDNNNDGNRILYMFRWNGSTWSEDFLIDPTTNWPDGFTRMMDIAYEEESGDALFVYADMDTTNSVRYRKRVAGVWDGSSTTAGTALDSRKRWVKAKAQMGTDTILVGYLNDNERIGALIWDGSTNTFGNQFVDDDSVAQSETPTSSEESFDIAWERQSGTPMIFFSVAAGTGGLIAYREFSSGAWQNETNLYTIGFTQDVQWVTANSDPRPTSDYIALAFMESDFDAIDETSACEFGMWDGSAAVTRPTEVTCRSDNDGRLITVQFENNTGQAVWIYNTSAAGTQLSWLTWTSAGGFTSSTTEAGASGNLESMQLHSDLNSESMIALYVDAAGALWDREWDGSSWSAKTAGAVHSDAVGNRTIQGTGENAEAYGFGFDRNVETMAAYRWFANNNGTSVVTALTNQDTPYTLTTANEIFRLRLLLYYPDSLAISGRNYQLQFIDPGTGTCGSPSGTGSPATWTAVAAPGSPGSTEISYYNNSTPADGDNLTSNGSDPTYSPYTTVNQDYEEGTAVSNPLFFTNSVSAMTQDQVGLWDFALIDNTTFDVSPQTFCFRVIRSNGIVLQIDKYPQISTASVNDVLIQSGTEIQSGTLLQ